MDNNVYPLPDRERRYDEASLWVARMDKQLSDDEQRELQAWMADPENRAVLFEMAKLWDKMDALSRLSGLFPGAGRQRPRAASSGKARPALAMAASILVAAVVAWWLLPTSVPERIPPAAEVVAQQVYETAVGEHSNVTLPDGSQITLNTRSRVTVNYTPRERLLILERGEVHFTVAKDPDRPLNVVAGDHVVQAVGTEFNIEINEQQKIELVVTEGKVRVTVREPGALTPVGTKAIKRPDDPALPPEVPAGEPTYVSAGEAMLVNDPQSPVTPIAVDDIEVKLSWRNGNLVFRGESLEEAVKEVNRYTTVEFVIVDDSLKQVRVAGLFKAGDVAGFLATLQENFDIASQRLDDNTVLLTGN